MKSLSERIQMIIKDRVIASDWEGLYDVINAGVVEKLEPLEKELSDLKSQLTESRKELEHLKEWSENELDDCNRAIEEFVESRQDCWHIKKYASIHLNYFHKINRILTPQSDKEVNLECASLGDSGDGCKRS